MHILTHRGLDPAREGYFLESSREAFVDQLGRGFGLEFDLHFTKEGDMIISHTSPVYESDPHVISLSELIALIMKSSAKLSALHLKHTWQKPEYLDKLLAELEKVDTERLIIFDVKIETAQYLKEKSPRLHLAPSVSHPYDIERYSGAVGGTLITLEQAIQNKNLFDWVWLDEWDKTLYNKENFALLRNNGFKIALVTPELHATSPGLLGGESHQDALNKETLTKRIKEIIILKPNAVCTDWPDLLKELHQSGF
jgi:hypothetical protein